MTVTAISLSTSDARGVAACAVLGFLVVVWAAGGKLWSLIVGEDGRTSTSKLQAFMWTVVLAFGVLTLTLEGTTSGLDFAPDYLFLLGFPALAYVFAKSIVQQKIDNGDITKSPPASDGANTAAGQLEKAKNELQAATTSAEAAEDQAKANVSGAAAAAAASAQDAAEAAKSAITAASAAVKRAGEPSRNWRSYIGDIVNNDAGRTDIVDFQYVVFNLVAITYFLVRFFTDNAFPDIPDTLIALTGASAGTYVTNKLTLKQTPILHGIVPPSAPPETAVTLRGANLAGVGSQPDGTAAVTQVKFDGTAVPADSVNDTGVTVTVPTVDGYVAGKPKNVLVRVVNAAGLESNDVAFTIK